MIKSLRELLVAPPETGNRSVARITISPSDVTDALLSIGVKPGGVVMVHPDAIVAAQFPSIDGSNMDGSNHERLDLLIDAMLAAVGANGTLVTPTFSYSFTKGEVFNVRNTPSAVGMVSERFRKRPGVHRTADPIFSFTCSGPLARTLSVIPAGE